MSSIEWTDATWNPVAGCTRVSAGCDHCYAATMTRRLEAMGIAKYQGLTGGGRGHFNGVVRTHEGELEKPMRWRKPRRVFVNSMSDLFHPSVPFAFIDRVFAVMALTPNHTYQVLTKRPERMAAYMTEFYPEGGRLEQFILEGGTEEVKIAPREADRLSEVNCLPNVWLGTSIEDQAAADERIPQLLECPAEVRFVSAEPLLGPVIFQSGWLYGDGWDTPVGERLHWVIAGGESGPGARPCEISWIESLVAQCRGAGVACFVKQLGGWPMLRESRPGESAWGPSFEWPEGTSFGNPSFEQCWNGRVVLLSDRKGGDPSEWPEPLRVREFPDQEPKRSRAESSENEEIHNERTP